MFEIIDDVKIVGKAPMLNDVIVQMDTSMQEIAQDTEQIKAILLRFGDSIFGEQYAKACTAVQKLSSTLIQAAEFINSVQHDLVDYIDRVDVFQERAPSGLRPMPHNVQVVNVEVNTNHDQFTKDDYIYILNTLRAYINDTTERKMKIVMHKENIGSIWKDSQYGQFSQAIDDIAATIDNGTKALAEYADHLYVIISKLQGSKA